MERPRQRIEKLVKTVPDVETEISIPTDGNRYPTLHISWDEQKWGYTVKDCVQQLRSGDPVIEVAGADNPSIVTAVREGNPKQSTKEMEANRRRKLELVASTIQPSETLIVGQRIRELLSAARKAAPRPDAMPTATLSAWPKFPDRDECRVKTFLLAIFLATRRRR